MSVRCRVTFLALRELKASSMVQLTEQWSMMEWSLPAMPRPSLVLGLGEWPSQSSAPPRRMRMKRVTPSLCTPNALPLSMMPRPGAVCPAMVTYLSGTVSLSFSVITPATSNTIVRGPLSCVMP